MLINYSEENDDEDKKYRFICKTLKGKFASERQLK
jgi:hypothetical protein